MTTYPNSIDNDSTVARAENNTTEITAETINSIRDAVLIVEKTIGTNPQGNLSTLADRINACIDDDGNIKASALSGIGLVTLPITNAQIATNAEIEETKLSLDYTTSNLNAKISSAQSDILAVGSSLNSVSYDLSRHYTGAANRHDGYSIDVNTIRGGNTVGSALNNINNELTDHEINTSRVSHEASTVSVDNNFIGFYATNVQDALEELNMSRAGQIEEHQDSLHINGVENKSLNENSQGNSYIATLASTIFQTDKTVCTNILKVLPPNTARVTSKNINTRGLKAGQYTTLRVMAGGMPSYLDINFSSAPSIIPTQDIEDVVEKINIVAHSAGNHYPISAYNTNGELTIAHNIARDGYTIEIQEADSLSAATILGFADIVGTEFNYSPNAFAGYVNGSRVSEIKSLLKIKYTISGSATNLIAPGLGNLNNYGLITSVEGNVICNITSHTTSSANGSYYIVSFPTNSTFLLNTTIPTGSFELEIFADCLNFVNSSNGEIYDIFLQVADDGYGEIVKYNRITYGSIPYTALRAVSKDFSATSWSTVGNYLQFSNGTQYGERKYIPIGYTGQLNVLDTNGVDSALIEVYGGPSYLQKTIISNQFHKSDDLLYLSSVHYSGNFGPHSLKYISDRRQFGGSPDNFSNDFIIPTYLTSILKKIRNNGVLTGFDITSVSSTQFSVYGGKALVNGVVFDIPTKDVVINDFTANANWMLLIDKSGEYIIKDESDPGFSLSYLISGDSYGDIRDVTTLYEFSTNGSSITSNSFKDRRLFISKIDKKLFDIAEELNSISGGGSLVNSATAPIALAGTNLSLQYDNSTLKTSGGVLYADVSALPHNQLTNLTLSDDHTQYLLLAGRGSGQEITGDIGVVGGIVNVPLKTALDGYGISDVQQTSFNKSVKDSCDAYGSTFFAQSSWNNAVLPSLDGYIPYTGATADVDLGNHSLTLIASSSNAITATGADGFVGGYGIYATAGTASHTSGSGGYFYGGSNGYGIVAVGGSSLDLPAIFAVGGSDNGPGIYASGTGSGNGGHFTTGSTDGSSAVYGQSVSSNGTGIKGDGSGDGYGGYFIGGTAGYGLVVSGGTIDNPTTGAMMIIPQTGSAPSSPLEGAIYVDGTAHHIYCYLGGTWKQLDN